MRLSFLSTLLLGSVVAAQGSTTTDVINYPFLTGSGTSVTNVAGTGGGAPASGTLVNTNTTNSGWATGVNGGYALAGKDSASTLNYVDSGWAAGGTTGSITMAFFVKEAWPQTSANTLAYFISGVGSFRMFTGGVAYEGLYLRVWGGSDLILRSPTRGNGQPEFDLRAAAKKGWVHVAIRISEARDEGTWFINGTPFATQSLAGSKVSITGTGNLRVGMHTSATTGSNFDLDDFRFVKGEVDDHEIAAWAAAKLIPDVTELSISGTNQAQKLSIDVGSSMGVSNYWVFGSLTGTWPGVPLFGFNVPLNADPYTDIVMAATNSATFTNFRGVTNAMGQATATLNLPANTPAVAVGLEMHHAAIIYDISTGAWKDVTNAGTTRIVN